MAAPATTPSASMPTNGHGRDRENSGSVAICLNEASFHFFGQEVRSTKTTVWCREARSRS
jgi:hypothetical protein